MSTTPRFAVSRAQHGSPIIRDNDGNRPVLVLLRDTEMPAEAADVAAMKMARICAQALNRVNDEIRYRQREGGR